jgi:hypothetical protein
MECGSSLKSGRRLQWKESDVTIVRMDRRKRKGGKAKTPGPSSPAYQEPVRSRVQFGRRLSMCDPMLWKAGLLKADETQSGLTKLISNLRMYVYC